MPEIKWDIKRGSQIYRTVYDSRLKSWISSGYIKSGDVVIWRSGFSGWRKPEEIADLKSYFEKFEESQQKSTRRKLKRKTVPKKEIKNILIVDDEKDLCDLLSSGLRRRKYNVSVANTSKDAIACVKRNSPDLVFLDLRLPDGEGMKLLPKIKKIAPKTAVNIISAYGDEESREKAKSMGAYGFVDKPFTEDDIVKRIKEYQKGTRKKLRSLR